MRCISRCWMDGDKRTVTKFAWFPVRAIMHDEENDEYNYETRWLEKVTYVQEYYRGTWFSKKFIDEEE